MTRSSHFIKKHFKPARRFWAQACFMIWGALLLVGAVSVTFKTASAHLCNACCIPSVVFPHISTRSHVTDWHNWQREIVFGRSGQSTGYGTARLGMHEIFLVDQLFLERLLPAMMMMTEQLVANMMAQTAIIGKFIDADIQLETQLTYQRLSARAHKDYHPSFGMCVIGTNVRSLVASEFKGDLARVALSERALDRNMLNVRSVSAYSAENEKSPTRDSPLISPHNRLGYYLENTCDLNDMNRIPGRAGTGLFICEGMAGRGFANRDIDFANTVMGPRNINIDFTRDASEATDNERILEMSSYLYGVEPFPAIDSALLRDEKNIDDFLRTRSVSAKRSVAQNSFSHLVSLKARGTHMDDPGATGARTYSSEGTSEYMRLILQQLGIPETPTQIYNRYLSQKNEALDFPGATDPVRDEMSYYAQMEILSKKIFQRPEFYTNLYDKPANVSRKAASLQAIGMMLDRDIFETNLRTEMLISMLLELQVIKEQERFENDFAQAQ